MRKTLIPLTALLLGCASAGQNNSEIKVAAPVVYISPAEELPKQALPQSSQIEKSDKKYDYLEDKSLPELVDKLKREMKQRSIDILFSYPYGKYECGFSVEAYFPEDNFFAEFTGRTPELNYLKIDHGLLVTGKLDKFGKPKLMIWDGWEPIDYIDCEQGTVINVPRCQEIINYSLIIVREAIYHIDDKLESWGKKEWKSYVYKNELSPDFLKLCDFHVKLKKEQQQLTTRP